MGTISFTSFKDYMVFLYVHIAYADGQMHEKERELIINRIKRLYPGETNPDKKLDELLKSYIENAGFADQIIEKAHLQFNNVQFYKKYRVFMDLYNIINADGIVSQTEEAAMEKLKKVIGLEANQSGLENHPTD